MLNTPLKSGEQGESAFRIQIISLAHLFLNRQFKVKKTDYILPTGNPILQSQKAISIKRNDTTWESIAITKAYYIKGHQQLITVVEGS